MQTLTLCAATPLATKSPTIRLLPCGKSLAQQRLQVLYSSCCRLMGRGRIRNCARQCLQVNNDVSKTAAAVVAKCNESHAFALLNLQNLLFNGIFDDEFDHAHTSRLRK
ncbi:hypothetical protein C9890_0373 [Perkinsus sp. BL_2016]|nr:hypothetical protein C9890_0373 [Perkinsus sp. BL_2016]